MGKLVQGQGKEQWRSENDEFCYKFVHCSVS
jgi:hypothetical protein